MTLTLVVAQLGPQNLPLVYHPFDGIAKCIRCCRSRGNSHGGAAMTGSSHYDGDSQRQLKVITEENGFDMSAGA